MELNETGHMLESECDLKMHVRNLGYPLPQKIGGAKPLFRRICNSMANLTTYIFGTKHECA